MRLKRALSQIRPTEGQREKIYGDILDKLERLSEEPPEKEKETRVIMKRRKILTSVIAAAAAVVIAGGTVYAASPEVRETVNNILGINRQSTQDYYDIYVTDDNPSVNNVDIIKDALTVTENDFTEFAEGIRAKLVSVVNCGSFAEVLLEFEFDEPVKNGEYGLENLTIDAYPRFLPTYAYGFLRVSDSGKIYSTVRLENIEKIPEDMIMTMEFTTLDKANSQNVHNTDETYTDPSVKIYGNFSAKFTLGNAIKPTVIDIEPAEISWTHSRMGGETAHMEISGLKYSPKGITVDLRMLEDCLVIYNDENGGAQYFNCTSMFTNGIIGLGENEANPIKFKMSDGSLKYAQYYDISSNAAIDIDKNTLITTMDWIKASRDIYSDKPTTITFELTGIMDYTDVEAIIFCGKEIPITEKDF